MSQVINIELFNSLYTLYLYYNFYHYNIYNLIIFFFSIDNECLVDSIAKQQTVSETSMSGSTTSYNDLIE